MPARNSRHAIAFVALALLTVIGIGTALLLDQMRRTARDAADGVVQRAASVVESTVNRLFLQIDGTLASLPGLVGQVSHGQDSGAEEVSRILRSINFQNLNFRDLLLVRPDGVAWASALAAPLRAPAKSKRAFSARLAASRIAHWLRSNRGNGTAMPKMAWSRPS